MANPHHDIVLRFRQRSCKVADCIVDAKCIVPAIEENAFASEPFFSHLTSACPDFSFASFLPFSTGIGKSTPECFRRTLPFK